MGFVGVVVGALGSMFVPYIQHKFQRVQQIDALRRQTYTDWLHEIDKAEFHLSTVNKARGQAPTQADRQHNYSQLSMALAMKRLEEIRMNSTVEAEKAATAVWTLLKMNPEWRGSIVREYKTWADYYWQARRNFIDAVRVESGDQRILWQDKSRYLSQEMPEFPEGDLVAAYVALCKAGSVLN